MFVFNSKFQTLIVVLRPSQKTVIGAQVVTNPGVRAHFQRGVFVTEDEEVAQALRDKIRKLRINDIVEITREDALAFDRPKEAPNQRGAVTARDSKAILGATDHIKMSEAPASFKCPVDNCGRDFDTNQKLQAHLYHHRKDKVDAPVAQGPVEVSE